MAVYSQQGSHALEHDGAGRVEGSLINDRATYCMIRNVTRVATQLLSGDAGGLERGAGRGGDGRQHNTGREGSAGRERRSLAEAATRGGRGDSADRRQLRVWEVKLRCDKLCTYAIRETLVPGLTTSRHGLAWANVRKRYTFDR